MIKARAAILCVLWLPACERGASRSGRSEPLATTPVAPSELPKDPNARLDLFVREEQDAELQFSPSTATWLGVHGFDDRLDDVRLDAVAREAARLRAMLDKLRALDEHELDASHALDRRLLERRCQGQLFELTELRPLERNPIAYVDLSQSAIHELVADDSLPISDRVRNVTARLWKLRPLFDEARRNLRAGSPQGVAELAVRKAVELGQEQRAWLAETVPRALAMADPSRKATDELRAALGDATRALDDFLGWLARDLAPRARGDLALGAARLVERLRIAEQIELRPDELVQLGERDVKETRRRLDEAAHALGQGKPGIDVQKLVEDDHAKPDELTASTQATLESLIDFVRREKLITLPEPARPKVLEMPPGEWGFAQLSVARPLEARPREAVLLVDPVDKAWPDRRKQEHLRTLNRAQVALALAHQLAHFLLAERLRRAPSTAQKLALAASLDEGWPSYFERMVIDQGFGSGDAKLRWALERTQLLRSARLVAAVRFHALNARLDDIVKVFADEAGLDDYAARREAERIAVDPLQLLDALGRLSLEQLRDTWRAQHTDAPLSQLHDAMLAHGSIPVATLRSLVK
jgi:uncharacterized protein (DUF885 family)